MLDAGGVCWYEDEASAIGSKPRGRIRIGWIRSASPAAGKGPGRFVLVCHVDGREHSYDLEARIYPYYNHYYCIIITLCRRRVSG